MTANAFTAEGEGAEVVSIGSTAQDRVYDVAVTSDGVIAVGSVGGAAKIDPCCNSVEIATGAVRSTGFVAWYDNDGELVQGFDIGVGAESVVREVEVASDGVHIVVTGTFTNGSIDLGLGPNYTDTRTAGASEYRNFIAVYEADATQVWAHDWDTGAFGPFVNPEIALDSSSIYLTTTANSTGIDIDPGTGTTLAQATGVYNAVIASYTFGGTYQWHKVVESDTWTNLKSIDTDGSSVVVSGIATGAIDLDTDSGTTEVVNSTAPEILPIIVSLDSSGTFVWGEALHEAMPASGFGAKIAVGADGTVYALGDLEGTRTLAGASGSTTSAGGNDAYLAQYDSAGTYLRHFVIGGAGDESPTSLNIDSNDNLVVTVTSGGNADLDPGSGTVNSSQGYQIVSYGGATHDEYLWSSSTPSIPETIWYRGDDILLIAGAVNDFGAMNINPEASVATSFDIVGAMNDTDGFYAFIDMTPTSSATTTTTTVAETTTTGAPTTTAAPSTTLATRQIISGEVWKDTNDNGSKDDGEDPVEDATVELADTDVEPTQTDADGVFTFNDAPAGDQTIRVTPPAGVSEDEIAVKITSSECSSCTVEKVSPSGASLPITGNSDNGSIIALLLAVGALATVVGIRRYN